MVRSRADEMNDLFHTLMDTHLSFLTNGDAYFGAFVLSSSPLFIVPIPALPRLLDNKEINLQSVH